jgi:ATP-dependent DNA helicase RecG
MSGQPAPRRGRGAGTPAAAGKSPGRRASPRSDKTTALPVDGAAEQDAGAGDAPAAARRGATRSTPSSPLRRSSLPVSTAVQQKLSRLGLERDEDLILHLPLRYEDETRLMPLAAAPLGRPLQLEAEVIHAEVQLRPRRQLVVRVADGGRELTLRFFSFYPNQQVALVPGARVRAFGEIQPGFYGAEMVHPRFRVVSPGEPLPDSLTPVYPTTAGLGQGTLRKLILAALARQPLADTLLPAERDKLDLPDFATALQTLHRPPPGLPAAPG